MSHRFTFRPGPLSGPLLAYCEKHGITPSEAIRKAVARLLHVEAPEMPQGNPGIGDLAADGAAARWKAKQKRRK